MTKLWETTWTEFVPFLDYSPEIRRRAKGHFPNEQAALKCL